MLMEASKTIDENKLAESLAKLLSDHFNKQDPKTEKPQSKTKKRQ